MICPRSYQTYTIELGLELRCLYHPAGLLLSLIHTPMISQISLYFKYLSGVSALRAESELYPFVF